MASFKYEIITASGKAKKGTLEAENIEAAKAQLRVDGVTIVSLSAASAFEKDLDIHIGKIVTPRELSVFCRQFESILNAGVTVSNALNMLASQTENKAFAKALRTVRDDIDRGENLADAMAAHPKIFPELMIHMVRAGEASGSLDVAFARVGVQFEKEAKIRGMVVGAMVYPAILMIVIAVVVVIMMTSIVPMFTASFEEVGGELPMITQVVIAISDFIVERWYVLVLGIGGAVFFIRAFAKTDIGAVTFGKLALKLPLVGDLTLKSACSRLCLTMSTLMGSGIQVVDAVHIVTAMMSNVIIRRVLEQAEVEIKNGVPLSRPLEDSDVFPPMVYHMVRIGEETGNMQDMLGKVADYYDEEVEEATKALLSAMEPLILVVMAAIVFPIVLAIMLPMYSMYDAIG